MSDSNPSTLSFEKELEILLNRHSMENGSNTPDFILAEYLRACLTAFDLAVTRRRQWWDHPEEWTAIRKSFPDTPPLPVVPPACEYCGREFLEHEDLRHHLAEGCEPVDPDD